MTKNKNFCGRVIVGIVVLVVRGGSTGIATNETCNKPQKLNRTRVRTEVKNDLEMKMEQLC